MCADKEIATKLVESDMLEILMAVSKLGDIEPARKGAAEIAAAALLQAEQWKIISSIKPDVDEDN